LAQLLAQVLVLRLGLMSEEPLAPMLGLLLEPMLAPLLGLLLAQLWALVSARASHRLQASSR
jgi:hypothetical protein